MALQELSPLPQPTGLSSLGQVLLGASEKYADQKQRDRDVADNRAYQQSQLDQTRAYQEGKDTRDRSARLEDDLALSRQRTREAGIQALVNEGYLEDALRNDQAAVATAYVKAQQAGLIDKYTALIDAGLLKAEDAGDLSKVTEAANKLGQINADKRTRDQLQQTRGDTFTDTNAGKITDSEKRIQDLQDQMRAANRIVSSGGEPSPTEVRKAAIELATAAKNGKVPSEAEITAQAMTAAKDLRDRRLFGATAALNSLNDQLQREQSIYQTLLNQQTTMGGKGFLPSGAAQIAPPPAAAAPAQPAGNPISGFLGTLGVNPGATVDPQIQQVLDQLNPPRQPAPPASLSGAPAPTEAQRQQLLNMIVQPQQAAPAAPASAPISLPRPAGRPITPSSNIFPTQPVNWYAPR